MTSTAVRDLRPSSRPDARLPEFSWFAFLAAAVVLVLLVPALLLRDVPDQGRSSAWRLGVVVLAWSGLRIAVLLGQGRARFFAFFFWLFCYVFFGVAATIQIRANQISTTTPNVPPSLDTVALGVVLLGLACFEIGALVAGLWAAGRRETFDGAGPPTPGPTEPVGPFEPGSATPARVNGPRTVLLWVVGMAIGLYYVHGMTIHVLLSSRDAAAVARTALFPSLPVRSSIIALATYPVLVSIGGLTLLRRREPRAEVRLLYAAMCVAGMAVLAFVVSPFSSARYPLGTVLFALALIFGAGLTPRRVRATLAAAVLGLFFVFPLADAFRRNVPDFARAGFIGEYLGNPDYDALWQVANAVTYWRDGAPVIGRQALGVLLFIVPRSTWAGKPYDTGTLLATYNGYAFGNLSAPLWAEAMVNGGLLAVIGVFVVLGFLLTRWDRLVSVSQQVGDLWFVGGAILAVYLMIILRGSLLQATGSLVAALLCVLFARGWGGSDPLPARQVDVSPPTRTPPPAPRR